MSFNGSNAWQQNRQQQQYPAFNMYGGTGFNNDAIFGGGNTIQYPQQQHQQQINRQGLNPIAFQQSSGSNNPGFSIGTVTKFKNDVGLVNDEVFFHRGACKGPIPKLGDRVVFEAAYSTGQFKWNATSIQLMPSNGSSGGVGGGSGVGNKMGYGHGDYARSSMQKRQHSPPSRRSRSPVRPIRRDRPPRDDDEHERKRRREDRDRDRSRERERMERERDLNTERERRERDRERERERVERERERVERSPHREVVRANATRRPRATRRYAVEIPKYHLAYSDADVRDMRSRYSSLYIPSDFFHAKIKWPEVFTPDNPFALGRLSQFHIMHPVVEPPCEFKAEELEPNDADYRYSAKVMLLACPPLAELYQKCFDDESNEDHIWSHPTRLIRFLVGTRGRNKELMAIGGPWSPSFDGANPDKDPAVLIRTAIRTCKALTGIDLSNCSQWYRFTEIRYHRTEYKNKPKDEGPRIETVVIYLPDIYSCMPSASEWSQLGANYKAAAEKIIARRTAASAAAKTAKNADDATAEQNENEEKEAEANDDSTLANNEAQDGQTQDEQEPMQEEEEDTSKPTHYSQLDLKTIKLQTLRDELLARNLPDKGSRNALLARLAKALNDEKEEEELQSQQNVEAMEEDNNEDDDDVVEIVEEEEEVAEEEEATEEAEQVENEDNAENEEEEEAHDENDDDWANMNNVDMSDIVILDEYDSNKQNEESPKEFTEKDKKDLLRRHKLPDNPHVLVHPNRKAKAGKFDCCLISLSALLDYSPDDNKERFFEVSYFAELFNEMLMRDFSFNIYKELFLHNQAQEAAGKNDAATSKESEENAAETNGDKNKDEKNDASKETTADANSSEKKEDDSNSAKSSNISNIRKRRMSMAKDRDAKELEKSDKKMVVVKPQLLLSFAYFDKTQCGYIIEKDLEELCTLLPLKLSRSQIRKLLAPLAVRNFIHYRKLTDKEENPEAELALEDAGNLDENVLRSIAAGNTTFVDDEMNCNQNDENEHDDEQESAEVHGDLVNYNGTVLHLGKLVDQIKRTERNYTELENQYAELRKLHTDITKENSKSNSKIKDLNSEVKNLSRKLTEADGDLVTLNRKQREQHAALSYIYNRVSPFFAREKDKDRKDKDKDGKEHKSEKDKDSKEHKSEKDKDSKDHKSEKDKDSKDHKSDKEKDVKDHKSDKEKDLKDHKSDKEKDVKDHKSDKEKDSKDPKSDKENEGKDQKSDKEKDNKDKNEKDKEKDKEINVNESKNDKDEKIEDKDKKVAEEQSKTNEIKTTSSNKDETKEVVKDASKESAKPAPAAAKEQTKELTKPTGIAKDKPKPSPAKVEPKNKVQTPAAKPKTVAAKTTAGNATPKAATPQTKKVLVKVCKPSASAVAKANIAAKK